MKNKELYELRFEVYLNALTDLSQVCKEVINEALQKNGKIEFVDKGSGRLFISYDGGNTPDQSSTLYSRLDSVYAKDGEIYFEVEHEPDYHIDRVPVSDLPAVINYLIDYGYV